MRRKGYLLWKNSISFRSIWNKNITEWKWLELLELFLFNKLIHQWINWHMFVSLISLLRKSQLSKRKSSHMALPTLVPMSSSSVSATSWPPGTILSSTLLISPEEKLSLESPVVWRSRLTEKSLLLTLVN